MNMNNPESRATPDPLVIRVAHAASAAQVADSLVLIWHGIDDALTPVLGQRGVVALYQRCLHVTGATYPWVLVKPDGFLTTVVPADLRQLVAKRHRTEAELAANAFLQTFYELLASLVGSSLTERLLRTVWVNSLSGNPAQDTSP